MEQIIEDHSLSWYQSQGTFIPKISLLLHPLQSFFSNQPCQAKFTPQSQSITSVTSFLSFSRWIKHSIILEMDKTQYDSWAELFKIHCRAFEVINHILPPATTDSTNSSQTADDSSAQTESWARLDAVVLQWIYGTISIELLLAIMTPVQTSRQAWDRLKDMFQDNQHSRAVYLQHKFSNIRQDDFPNMAAYRQEIKSIGDQLSDVRTTRLTDDQLVLQLITGLNESYQSMATNLHHRSTLPSFYQARSMLLLEETRKMKQASTAATTVGTALLTTTTPPNAKPSSSGYSPNRGNYSRGNCGNYRGSNNRNRGNFRGRGRNNLGYPSGYSSGPYNFGGPYNTHPQNMGYGPWAWQQATWNPLPCPYPTSNWTRPNVPYPPTNQPGLLGPRPPPGYAQSVTSSTPTATDIEAALHTMTLNPPDDNWYMDTGATSHMTGNQVRRLSIDNNISLEFDPFGFTVKDFSKGTPLMRCNSTGDLYPLHPSKLQQLQSHSAFTVLSSDLRHQRLGHPGSNVISSLRNKNYIHY
ncbi:uncharacterized protein [Rutidosis leptorrhynchoides]|uniref:uncharacterized protein n=1 Tax=Rutidosis leptorrhynchoides TaxID=125765 RepID=UPI003A9A5B3C